MPFLSPSTNAIAPPIGCWLNSKFVYILKTEGFSLVTDGRIYVLLFSRLYSILFLDGRTIHSPHHPHRLLASSKLTHIFLPTLFCLLFCFCFIYFSIVLIFLHIFFCFIYRHLLFTVFVFLYYNLAKLYFALLFFH